MQQFAQKYSSSSFLVLFTLWLIATILNLNKAFHIDDTFHLEAAQWIEHNPMRPMSGLINWDNNKISIYHYNQPPLYFYLIALVGSLFGYSEIPLHLFQSLFTLLAIVSFYKIADTFHPKQALILTVFFVLNPAFLINQNLMVDIPLLSLHLLFVYILIKPDLESATRYIIAAFVLSVALLIKYTSLPLIVLLLIMPILRREKKFVLAGLIPFLVMGLWSLFNYIEYGSIHLHGRSIYSFSFHRISIGIMSFILCLGAVTPFNVAFVTGISEKYRRPIIILTGLSIIIFMGVTMLWYQDHITASVGKRLYRVGLTINGAMALVIVFVRFSTIEKFKQLWKDSDIALLLLWGGGLGAFIILFAPFMATRHVLLVIPPILLLSSRLLDLTSSSVKIIGVVISSGLSLLLGVSDWYFADFYRKQAYEIKDKLPVNATVWSIGHWGWQWYSTTAGMRQFETDSDLVVVKDYVVVPISIAQQRKNQHIVMEEVQRIVPQNNMLTHISTSGIFASFYKSEYNEAPWALKKAPVDTIIIFQVKAVNNAK